MTEVSLGAAVPRRPGPVPVVSAPLPGPAAGRMVGLWRMIALVGSDAAALLLCGVGVCTLSTGAAPLSNARCASVAALIPLFLLAYGIGGLYPGFGVSAIQLIRTVARQTSLVFMAIIGSSLALPVEGDVPWTLLTLWWLAAMLVVPLMRRQVSLVAARSAWWRQPVILFGTPDRVDSILDSLSRARHLGYRPAALILVHPGLRRPRQTAAPDLPVIAEHEAIDMARRLGVGTVLLAGVPGAEQKAADLRPYFRHVILVNPLESLLIEPTAVRYLGRAIGIEYRNGLLLGYNRVLKRTVDIVLGILGMILFAPLAAAAALSVVLSSGGSWRHGQVRVGRSGAPFTMWKLRTMFQDAEERLHAHLASNVVARREWQSQFKLSRDPRIVPGIGRLLRRWSLDEYPQFWHVIRGEMSLVGPRPLPTYHLDAFPAEFRELRQHVRPGITGMWQVMSRGDGTAGAQESLDRYYIYNWSIWLDAFLLARTIQAVITGHGAR